MFALASAKARDLATMTLFAELLSNTLNVEMQLHRDYCQRLGIAGSALAKRPPRAGHAWLYKSSAECGIRWPNHGNCGSCFALPTGLCRNRRRARDAGTRHANPFYAEWIAMYTSKKFVEGAERLAHLLDELSFGLPMRDIDQLETIFLTSSRYEYLFWEMSWNRGDGQSDQPISAATSMDTVRIPLTLVAWTGFSDPFLLVEVSHDGRMPNESPYRSSDRDEFLVGTTPAEAHR